ncbi:MAG: serine/threonine protein kinase [Hydrococcus sp. Prado102]|jgi:serine/threonine protein kinase|nr:serine/threonine protein kinase [Hydrococcus sp. Prado102]
MFNTGDILNQNYQLQQRLGNTATGHQTWLAIDLQSQEQITIKLLAFNPQMRWEELKLFEREAQILQTLNYSRIPRYRDYFDIDKDTGGGVPWFALVQDYIPGCSLQELIEQGKRFTEEEVRSFVTQTLEILIYLHELKPPVLHRDIKPSNIILGEDDRIYLIDFGAVQAQAAVTGMTFTIVGMSGYAPLEQFWGRAIPASDLYALGATLIHLLTGIAPADLPQKDSRIQFSDRVNLQSNLLGWIEKATDISIEKRFSSAREALHYLNFQLATTSRKTQLINLENSLIKRQLSIDNSIEILIPAFAINVDIKLDFATSIVIFIYFLIIIIIFLYLWWIKAIIDIDFEFNFLAIVLPFVILVFICTNSIVRSYNYKIILDREKFVLRRKYLQKSIWKKSNINGNFINVLRRNIEVFFMCQKGKQYQVFLKTKDDTYLISNNLNRYEAAWLTQELRNWLEDNQN